MKRRGFLFRAAAGLLGAVTSPLSLFAKRQLPALPGPNDPMMPWRNCTGSYEDPDTVYFKGEPIVVDPKAEKHKYLIYNWQTGKLEKVGGGWNHEAP